MTKNRDERKNHPNAEGELQGITEIRVGGFKSIVRPQAIEIRPLTILAGANSSGKSSFLQPLLLLKQTLDAPYDPGPLLLDGPNVKFTSGEQILSRVSAGVAADSFSVGFSITSRNEISLAFRYEPKAGFQTERVGIARSGNEERIVYPGMTPSEVQQVLGTALGVLAKYKQVKVIGERCFLGIHLEFGDGRTERLHLASPTFSAPIEGLLHVPSWRGSPERSYPVTAVGSTFPGTFEKYVASVIAHWQAGKKQERLDDLNRQLTSVGLNSFVNAVRATEVHLELRVARLLHPGEKGPNDSLNIADVGFGVPSALPVLVALLAASPGQTVYIEQPEIHLHPKAQVQMASILAEAARRGVRVIAETHSSLLLRAVQTLVAKGELARDLVKLHWFMRNEKDGATEVHSADLDADGAFGEWPSDFSEVELRSEGDYLDAVGLRSAR